MFVSNKKEKEMKTLTIILLTISLYSCGQEFEFKPKQELTLQDMDRLSVSDTSLVILDDKTGSGKIYFLNRSEWCTVHSDSSLVLIIVLIFCIGFLTGSTIISCLNS